MENDLPLQAANDAYQPTNEFAVLVNIIGDLRPRKQSERLARQLLDAFGGLGRVLREAPGMTGRIEGMSEDIATAFRKSTALVAAITRAELCRGPVLDAGRKVADYCRSLFGDRETEHLFCLYLDSDYRLVFEKLIQEGTVNHVTVYPREIFRHALVEQASRIVLVHNHPSGNTRPSACDRAMTRELCEISARLGIDVADHVIVGGAKFFSFRERGMLTGKRKPSASCILPFAIRGENCLEG